MLEGLLPVKNKSPFFLSNNKNGEIKAVEYNNLYDMKVINKNRVLSTSGSPQEVLAPTYKIADLKNFVNRYLDKYRKNKPEIKNNNNGNASYSSVLKTGVKVGAEETAKEADFKLYQRTYDLAKKYMKGNIAESKYRPKNSLGVYYNYGSGKGNS